MAEIAHIVLTKEIHKAAIMAKPNVVGIGAGYRRVRGKRTREVCIVTLVTTKLPRTALSAEALVPRELDGIPTDVLEVGEIRAYLTPKDRWRPAPAGVSIGHHKITAGTLGFVVRDRVTGARLILSNNHVLANSNDAQIGDPILQPGPADGGVTGKDTIATLERFQPIRYTNEPGTCNLANVYAVIGNTLAKLFGSKHQLEAMRIDTTATNTIDAALARPVNDADVLDEIMVIGNIAGTEVATLGMKVRKSGRTTGYTDGEVLVLDTTVDVSYGTDRVARFEEQIVAGRMSEGGDSGSLVVTGAPPKAVGLLFAGSDQTTVMNPIQMVLDALEVTL